MPFAHQEWPTSRKGVISFIGVDYVELGANINEVNSFLCL